MLKLNSQKFCFLSNWCIDWCTNLHKIMKIYVLSSKAVKKLHYNYAFCVTVNIFSVLQTVKVCGYFSVITLILLFLQSFFSGSIHFML